MTQNHLARRSILKGAGVGALAVGATAVSATAASADSSGDHGGTLLGAWLITHRDPTDPKPVRAVVTFAPGGALASNDFDPPSPPGLGGWESDGDHRFQAVFWLGDRDPSDPTATVQVRVRTNGHWQDDEIGGTFHADVFSGGHLIASPKGTFQGHRLEP